VPFRHISNHECCSSFVTTAADVSDFIQFEIWDIPGQFKLGDIDAVATFSCTGTLIFIIDSQVDSSFNCIQTCLDASLCHTQSLLFDEL